MEKLKVSMIVLTTSLFYSVGAVEKTFVAGNTEFLECVGHAADDDTYIWTDVSETPSVRIYTVNEEITKTHEAAAKEKYDNFLLMSSFPVSTRLSMAKIALEDRGTYTCELELASTTIEQYIVRVEAEPETLLITCSGRLECPPPPPELAPSMVDCFCKATGVFPESLDILGNGAVGTKTVSTSLTGPLGSYDISSDFVLYPTASENDFRCTISGYAGNVEPSKTTTTYLFRPPICELEVTELTDNCTTAWLTCICNNAAPAVNVYTFYDENRIPIGEKQTTNIIEVEIPVDETIQFYCSGCNGVNYGTHSFAEKSLTCQIKSTTAEPQTTPSDDGQKGIGCCVGLISGVVVIFVSLSILAFVLHRKSSINNERLGTIVSTILGDKTKLGVIFAKMNLQFGATASERGAKIAELIGDRKKLQNHFVELIGDTTKLEDVEKELGDIVTKLIGDTTKLEVVEKELGDIVTKLIGDTTKPENR